MTSSVSPSYVVAKTYYFTGPYLERIGCVNFFLEKGKYKVEVEDFSSGKVSQFALENIFVEELSGAQKEREFHSTGTRPNPKKPFSEMTPEQISAILRDLAQDRATSGGWKVERHVEQSGVFLTLHHP